MICTVNSQRLAAELRPLAKVVPAKPAIPILSHALLTAEGDKLRLQATDLEVALTGWLPAEVQQSGLIALPVGKLLAMVEQFPDADVQFGIDGQHVELRCGAFRSRLMALASSEFPQLTIPDGQMATIDAESLRLLISRTRYAINATSSKFVLQGALLTMTGSIAAMVATDARRLVLTTVGRNEGPDIRIVIPMKAMDVLASGVDVGDVELTVGKRHLFFQVGDRLLTSRTLEGEFPAYERIVPTTNDKVITANRAGLRAALKRVLLAAEENKATYFEVESGKLTISARSAEVGTAEEAIAVGYEGAALKVCLNGDYVLDFLDASVGQFTTIKLKDAKTAMLMMDGDDHVGVAMLMRA